LTDQPFQPIIDDAIVALRNRAHKRDFGMEGMRYWNG